MVKEGIDTSNAQDEMVTTWGFSSFIVTLTKSGFLGMASYMIFSLSSIDSYISAIIGAIIAIIPLCIFIFMMNNSKNMDIIDLNMNLYGKIFGNVLNFILFCTIFFMAVLSLYNISQFVDTQYMPDTDTNYLRIILLIPIVYAASKNINVIARISQIVLFINFGIFILTLLGLIGECDIQNMFPIMKDGINMPFISSLVYAIFTSFPIFLLTIIPQSKVLVEKHKTKKIFFMYGLANFMLITIIFTTILILGEELIPMFRYPEYIALKRFSLFTLIERVENTLSLQFVFNAVIYLIMSFYFLAQTLKKIFKNINNTVLVYIIAIITLVLSNFIFKNTTQAIDFIKNMVPYIVLIGIIGVMFITFIGQVVTKIKSRNN